MNSRTVLFLIIICASMLGATAGPARAGLEYATFAGGPGIERGEKVDFDSSGNVVILCTAGSAGFPTTPGAFDSTFSDLDDMIVAKLSPDLSTLIAATYFGGGPCNSDPMEEARDLLVGLDDTVTVCGWTWCDTFPTTAGAYQEDIAGWADGFLIQLSADLTTLLYGTYIGDTYHVYTGDSCNALAMDGDGWIYTAGHTDWEWIWLQRWAPDLGSFGGGSGGYWNCIPQVLTVNEVDGSVYMAGLTESSSFEASPGAWDTTYNGGVDIVVKRFSESHAELEATYVGSPGNEGSLYSEYSDWLGDSALAITDSGDVVLAGHTDSAAFPVTAGAYDTTFNGEDDGFVLRLSADLSTLAACTYLGSTGIDSVYGMGITERGTVILTGLSGAGDFPSTPGAWDETSVGTDGFIAEMSGDLDQLLYATFIGGDDSSDDLRGMRINADGKIVAAGRSSSTDFPATPGAYDTGFNGAVDMVAVVFDIPPVTAELTCLPALGTLPFNVTFSTRLAHGFAQTRRLAGRVDIQLAGGASFPNWRSGFTNVAAGSEFTTTWGQNLPRLGSLIGDNIFTLEVEDVTPAPWNQPPYPASGSQATGECMVTGL